MAVITGTTGTDTLRGGVADDVFLPMGTTVPGGRDIMIDAGGADIYDLSRNTTATLYNFLIRDNSADGAVDAIENAGALYQSASLGYQGWATAERIGDDLVIHLPHKPYRFRDPSRPAFDIRIDDHFTDGTVESLEAGGVTYQLAAGVTGSVLADIVAGGRYNDALSGLDGDDWLFGNRGHDTIDGGNGDDVVFGGAGQDSVLAGSGNDTVFGENGNDRLFTGDGFDWVEGGAGRDFIDSGADGDRVDAGEGNDVIRSGDGQDTLTGGAGNDRLIGGRDGDTYVFFSDLGDAGFGKDTILEAGNAPSYLNTDIIELRGFYGPSSDNQQEAAARLSFVRDGQDMIIIADDGVSEIRVANMFHANANRWFIEHLQLNGGYWTPIQFWFVDGAVTNIGDDRDHGAFYGGEVNEVLFGTDGDDEIFGNAGMNFIWTGAGADVLIYKENDPENLFGYGGGLSHDIVEDFDILLDRLDFTEMGISFSSLTISEDSDGDALISWTSGDFEVSSILIELRGVSADEVTADLFLF